MKTAFIHHPLFKHHDTGASHPENYRRYGAIMDVINSDKKLAEGIIQKEAKPISKGIIQACHTPAHYKHVEKSVENGEMYLDADTIISPKSLDAAIHAAGGACLAVDLLMKGEAKNAFIAARPPGHHATGEKAMGFCLFNNVAIASRYAQSSYPEIEKVAIIDWDVHHGNGTQGIFYDDPSVFFFSMHQYPWYPGTGSFGETGFGRGKGFTKNLTIKANTPAKTQKRVFETAVEEIAKSFKPDLIMISAGFDAHESDPLGQLMLEDEDYVSMTKTLRAWADEACSGRLISCLEGGYNLKTLGETVRAHVSELSKG